MMIRSISPAAACCLRAATLFRFRHAATMPRFSSSPPCCFFSLIAAITLRAFSPPPMLLMPPLTLFRDAFFSLMPPRCADFLRRHVSSILIVCFRYVAAAAATGRLLYASPLFFAVAACRLMRVRVTIWRVDDMPYATRYVMLTMLTRALYMLIDARCCYICRADDAATPRFAAQLPAMSIRVTCCHARWSAAAFLSFAMPLTL